MKAIACAIMFGVFWHTPLSLWNELTDFSKSAIAVWTAVMFISFCAFLGGEKS